MGLTFGNQVLGDLALGQSRFRRDCHILALNIDGIQQRDGHLDFIGAFEFLIVFYGQGPHFFWA